MRWISALADIIVNGWGNTQRRQLLSEQTGISREAIQAYKQALEENPK